MTWTDMTRDWATWYRALQMRFPALEDSAMPFCKTDRGRFEAYLAQSHGLTLNEAHEVLEQFIELTPRENDRPHQSSAA